jgi:hypothetical protein
MLSKVANQVRGNLRRLLPSSCSSMHKAGGELELRSELMIVEGQHARRLKTIRIGAIIPQTAYSLQRPTSSTSKSIPIIARVLMHSE